MEQVYISVLTFILISFVYFGLVLSDRATLTNDNIIELTTSLPLDHFDNDNKATFATRLFARKDLWRFGGPLYIYIGGEHPVEHIEMFLTGGLMADLARETGGIMFLLEHRYFGKSKITEDQEEKRYKYLSVDQVVADVAHFIRQMKRSLPFYRSKVVVVGGSYSGRLATWMRLKHPELVDAAVASSAPLKNTHEFPELYNQVADVYKEYGGNDCLRAIQNKIRHERDLLSREGGEDELKDELNYCSNVEVHLTPQIYNYGSLNLNHITKPVCKFNVEKILQKCEEMLSPIHSKNSSWCYYNNFNVTGWLETPYDYLRCTELAQYPTSTNDSVLPFEVPLNIYTNRCAEVYGEQYNGEYIKDTMRRMDEKYGGVTPNVTKVVFVNGDLDPWHHLGVLEDLSAEAPALLIRNGTHCQDLFPEKPTDSQDLKETRLRIKELIKNWIGYRT